MAWRIPRYHRAVEEEETPMDSTRTRGTLARVAAVVALAATPLALPLTVSAQDKPVELKFGYWIPPAHSLIPSSQEWADSIAKASNGSIKVTIYPSEQLGKAFDHYDMSRDGIADIALVNPGYQPGRFPIVGASELPFIFANATSGSRAFDEWYRRYAGREMRDVRYCLGFAHDPGSFHLKKKVTLPVHMKGLKVRPAHATLAQYITLMGGTTVQASAPQMRDVLEKGVADATASPWDGIFLFKVESLVKFHIDEPIYVATFAWTMNTDKYNGMSAAQKKVIDGHCTPEWAEKIATPWAKREEAGRPKLRALADHDVYKLKPEELAEWRKAADPLHKRWADAVRKVGGDPDAIMKDLRATLQKHNALY